jgi:hypothetical protein
MSDFLRKIRHAQAAQQTTQNSLAKLKPANIDSIVNAVCTHLENDILYQANGHSPVGTHTQYEGNFIRHQYEYHFYSAEIPLEFKQAPCPALYHHYGGESDYDNEKFVIGVRNIDEAKQIAIAIIRRLSENKLQIPKTAKNDRRGDFAGFYTIDELISLIHKSPLLKLNGCFSTRVYYMISKTQKR